MPEHRQALQQSCSSSFQQLANLITIGQLQLPHSHKPLPPKLQVSGISALGTLISQYWRNPSSSYTAMGPFCGAPTFPTVYTLDHAGEGLVPGRASVKVNHFVTPNTLFSRGSTCVQKSTFEKATAFLIEVLHLINQIL